MKKKLVTSLWAFNRHTLKHTHAHWQRAWVLMAAPWNIHWLLRHVCCARHRRRRQRHFAITAMEPASSEDDENVSEGSDPLKVTLQGSILIHTNTHVLMHMSKQMHTYSTGHHCSSCIIYCHYRLLWLENNKEPPITRSHCLLSHTHIHMSTQTHTRNKILGIMEHF